jgi:hypothetical protein
LVYYQPTKTDKEYVSPDGLEKIFSYAFFEAKNLEKILLTDSVITVGSYAFQNCTALNTLQLPDNEIYLGDNFINGCTCLEIVRIPKGAEVRIKQTPAKYIEFLDGRTEIKGPSIENNNRKPNVIVPTSVTKISGISVSEYFGMSQNLPVSIYYKGTADEWAKVELGKMGTDDITVYYYSESEPPLNADGTAYDGNYWYYGDDGLPVIWEYNA